MRVGIDSSAFCVMPVVTKLPKQNKACRNMSGSIETGKRNKERGEKVITKKNRYGFYVFQNLNLSCVCLCIHVHVYVYAGISAHVS